jgi:hypothetical protein
MEILGVPKLVCPDCNSDIIFCVGGVSGKCFIKTANNFKAEIELAEPQPFTVMYCLKCFHRFTKEEIEKVANITKEKTE